jgi:hypothetical protein
MPYASNVSNDLELGLINSEDTDKTLHCILQTSGF